MLIWPLNFRYSLTFLDPQHPQLFKQVTPVEQKSSRMNKYSYKCVEFCISLIGAIMCKLNDDSVNPVKCTLSAKSFFPVLGQCFSHHVIHFVSLSLPLLYI